ncbi:MAG: septum formation initiator family protein [Hyphomicrobiaceae bacterium]
MLRRTPNHDRRSGPRKALVLLSCLGLTGYFAYHAIHGRHGLETRSKLISRSEALEFEINGLETVRARLRREVALLSKDTPDPDIVEDVAREVLGLVRPDERLIVGR